jgi:hypothetical protein
MGKLLNRDSLLKYVTKICPNCGQENLDTFLYCKNCGASLAKAPISEEKKSEAPKPKVSEEKRSGFNFSLLLIIGGAAMAVGFMVQGISEIILYLGEMYNYPVYSPEIVSLGTGIFSSVFFIIISVYLLFIALKYSFPDKLGSIAMLIFLMFVLMGISFVMSSEPVSGFELFAGGSLIFVASLVNLFDTPEAKVSSRVIAIIGSIFAFLAFYANPVSPISSSLLFIILQSQSVPMFLYEVFGFFGSYGYISIAAIVIALVSSAFYDLVRGSLQRRMVELIMLLSLLLFASGILVTGYLIVSNRLLISSISLSVALPVAIMPIYVGLFSAMTLAVGWIFIAASILLLISISANLVDTIGEVYSTSN